MKAPIILTLQNDGEVVENLDFFKGVRPCLMDFGGFSVLVTTKGAGLFINDSNMTQLRNLDNPTNALLANYKYETHEMAAAHMNKIIDAMDDSEDEDIIL